VAFACRAYSPHTKYAAELEWIYCVYRLFDLRAEYATPIGANAKLLGSCIVVVAEPRLWQMDTLDDGIHDTATWWAKARFAVRFVSNYNRRQELIAASAGINDNICGTVLF
jgi:hypothetical protein